jgi:hypothetical protein
MKRWKYILIFYVTGNRLLLINIHSLKSCYFFLHGYEWSRPVRSCKTMICSHRGLPISGLRRGRRANIGLQ